MSDTYPCIQCFEHCSEPCIQCSRCERWVHITCVPMTESDLKSWDNHLLNFYCKQCCYSGIDFDSAESLARLQKALDSGRRNALVTSARNEQKLLHTYSVSIPLFVDVTSHEVDTVSQSVLQMFHPALLNDFYPANVIGDGNCMYRAVSRALSGTENFHSLLRLKTSLEIILNRQFYDHKSKSYKDLICDNRVIVSDYEKLVQDAIALGSYAELAHIYALSASVGKPVRSYFPPQMFSDFLSEPFTRKVVGRNVRPEGESVATLMWTQMHVPRSMRDFNPNHFVTIISRTEPIPVVIDLNTPFKTYENITVSDCTKNKSVGRSLLSVIGASLVESPSVDKTSVSMQSSVALDESPLDVVDSSLDLPSITNSANNEVTSKSEFDTHCKYGNDDTSISDSESVLGSPGDCNKCGDDTGVSKSDSVLDSPRDCNNTESALGSPSDCNKCGDDTGVSKSDSVLDTRDCNNTESVLGSPGDCNNCGDDTGVSKSDSVLDSPRDCNNTESVLGSPGDCNNFGDDTGVSKSDSVLDSPRDCNNSDDSAIGVKSDSLVADVSASSTSTTDSFIQTFDRKTCDHLDGAFLEVEGIIRVLAENEKPLEYIPDGVKENVYFVIKNEKNIMTRGRKNRSNFRDDCGVWESGKGTTPKTCYLVLPSGDLKKIVKRRDQNDLYCFEKKAKGKFYYTPLNPQPTDDELLHLHRYYAYLKEDNNYRKRVSWLSLGGNTEIAVAEYIGDYPGLAPHGNSKNKPEYVRTPHHVMVEMGEMLKTNKPQHVYDKLTAKYDELSGPANFKQVYNKRDRDKAKARKDNGQVHHRRNFADHIKEIENQVTANHSFIRSVVRQSGRAPAIILYSDEQITDLKNLCCTGHTVLGVDKTFNLCDMHVTVSCYKQLAVTRESTADPPLFFGPMYIHDHSDFESYSTFFSHLKTKLSGVDTNKLVIGTDDERALVNAITSSFSDAKHVLCTRHMRQNVNQKLTDASVDKSDRQMLLNKIFGEDGIINANDTICFEEKCEEVEALSQSVSQPFLRYFQKRVKENLDKKRKEPELVSQADKQWTNNNCESLNHVLKQNIEWKSQPLLDLIEAIQELVDVQFKDLRRSLVGTGQFKLADTHKQFAVSRSVWAGKTQAEKDRHYNRFRAFVVKDSRIVSSTNGESDVVAPKTKGKKINQGKRKRTERTVSLKKAKN